MDKGTETPSRRSTMSPSEVVRLQCPPNGGAQRHVEAALGGSHRRYERDGSQDASFRRCQPQQHRMGSTLFCIFIQRPPTGRGTSVPSSMASNRNPSASASGPICSMPEWSLGASLVMDVDSSCRPRRHTQPPRNRPRGHSTHQPRMPARPSIGTPIAPTSPSMEPSWRAT